MLNKVILMGRLVADPELRQTSNNISVCRFRIAVNRPYSKDGERVADFISISAWRQTAEFVHRYFSKGKMIIVEGSLRNNDYTDNNGVKHYSMEVLADSVSFGESKSAMGSGINIDESFEPPVQQQTQNTQSSENASAPIQIGDLSDFEEILSDGEIPF
jgi:single-strand DNA-binding protein